MMTLGMITMMKMVIAMVCACRCQTFDGDGGHYDGIEDDDDHDDHYDDIEDDDDHDNQYDDIEDDNHDENGECERLCL